MLPDIVYFVIPEKHKDKITETDLETRIEKLSELYPDRQFGWLPLQEKSGFRYIKLQNLMDMLYSLVAADIVYLWKDWVEDSNCNIIFNIATENNIPVLYETVESQIKINVAIDGGKILDGIYSENKLANK